MTKQEERIYNTIKGILCVVGLFLCFYLCGYVETHYTRTDCTVVNVDNNIVTVEDRVGYLWSYETDETPRLGSKVDVHMYTNGTDSYIYDDVVTGITYSK